MKLKNKLIPKDFTSTIKGGCKILWCCSIKKQNSHIVAEAQSNYFSVFSVPLRRIFYAKNQTILQSPDKSISLYNNFSFL